MTIATRYVNVIDVPGSNREPFVKTVLALYVDLPDTPLRASAPDQRQASSWFDRGIPLILIETGLLLAFLRRTARPLGAPPPPKICSLAYFQQVIEELLETPAPTGYLRYLQCLRQAHAGQRPEHHAFR
jgi:hypothetical protein